MEHHPPHQGHPEVLTSRISQNWKWSRWVPSEQFEKLKSCESSCYCGKPNINTTIDSRWVGRNYHSPTSSSLWQPGFTILAPKMWPPLPLSPRLPLPFPPCRARSGSLKDRILHMWNVGCYIWNWDAMITKFRTFICIFLGWSKCYPNRMWTQMWVYNEQTRWCGAAKFGLLTNRDANINHATNGSATNTKLGVLTGFQPLNQGEIKGFWTNQHRRKWYATDQNGTSRYLKTNHL